MIHSAPAASHIVKIQLKLQSTSFMFFWCSGIYCLVRGSMLPTVWYYLLQFSKLECQRVLTLLIIANSDFFKLPYLETW